MTQKLSGVNHWCVTGTPVMKDLTGEDLTCVCVCVCVCVCACLCVFVDACDVCV